MPKNTSDSAPMAEDRRGSRNSRTSRDGWLILLSYQAKKTRISRPAAARPSTSQWIQEPLSPPWMMPYTSRTRPAMEASTTLFRSAARIRVLGLGHQERDHGH